MSLFVSDDDLIGITVYYTQTTNKRNVKIIRVIEEEKAKGLLQDPKEADKVKTLNAKFKPPTWSAQQRLFAQSAVYNPANSQKETDWSLLSDLQLKENLVAWDIVDVDGREYPVTPELIDQLPAAVANELLAQYRRSMTLEENEGN